MAAFEALEILVKFTPLDKLPAELLSKIAESSEIKTFPRGTYVFRQGDPGSGFLYFIHRGSAEVLVTSDQGTESVVSLRHQGDFFGETGFFSQKTYTGSVRAREEMTCLLIPNHIFEMLIDTLPEFARQFIRVTTERMRHLYDEIVEEQSADSRLYSDPPLFRKRLGQIMASPVITCRREESVQGVAQAMADHNISSVVVVDDFNRPAGLITERDLVRRVLVKEAGCRLDLKALEVMNPVLVKLSANDFFYEALLAVVKDQATHLLVLDGEKLVGIVSLRQLIKTRSTGTLWLSSKVRELSSKKDLTDAGRELDSFLKALVEENASITEIFEIMANIHDRLTRRIIRLCEEEMVAEGYGPPPVFYSWFDMGSSGRREQVLRTDQDNAIVYEDDPENADFTAAYFLKLGAKVVEWLELAGFVRCNGGVMADNPEWCMSLSRWKSTTEGWIRNRRPAEVRRLTIFLDFRWIYGHQVLTESLRQHSLDLIRQSEMISHLLTEDDVMFRVPLSLWGGFITEKSGPNKGEISLKNTACNHIVNCVRTFAVKHDISETSTLGRLAALVQKGVMSPEDGEYFDAAYRNLMSLRLRENIKKIKEGRKADNYINPYKLNKLEQGMLKDAFQAISRLQKLTSASFEIPWMGS